MNWCRTTLDDLRRIQASSFASTFDRFVMPPMLISISRSLHVPLAHVVAAASLYYLFYGLMQPIWGLLSTRIGIIRTIQICTLAGALATLSSAFASSIWTLTISRCIAGACFSACVPGGLIYVGITASPVDRHKGIAELMTATALGTALATVVAGITSSVFGWRFGFGESSIIGLFAFLLLRPLNEIQRTPFKDPFMTPILKVMRNRSALTLLLLALCDGAAILGGFTFIPSMLESQGNSTNVAAAVTALYGLSVLVSARLVSRFASRFSRSKFILYGSLVGSASFVELAFGNNILLAMCSCICLGVSWATMHTSLQAWATEVVPSERSLTVSLFAGTLFAGSSFTASLNGGNAQNHHFSVIFLEGALLLLLVGVVGSTYRIRWESKL
jgi:predicted MFS family arabinose efflux permease